MLALWALDHVRRAKTIMVNGGGIVRRSGDIWDQRIRSASVADFLVLTREV